MTSFRALTVDQTADGFVRAIREWDTDQLPEGELLIRVSHSGINYKDGLAGKEDGKIVSRYPFIPGIDLAGTVVSSEDARFAPGDEVLVTGYGLGVSHWGGLAGFARVPAAWAVPLPAGLTPAEAMAYGTAGLTAALCVARLVAHGLKPADGPVLVTGAGGGVGSAAVALLARLGYSVAAATGKPAAHDWLRELGAAEILPREEVLPAKPRALAPERWAGAVDPVGGAVLAHVIASLRYGGAVAACGLAGGGQLPATVFPFILRGVSLLGVDSVECPMEERHRLWKLLASDWKPEKLGLLYREIALDEVPGAMDAILRGEVQGRLVVDMSR
ncbi:oxidoreductase [Gorillibacterium sp. CAU 1737]|uniref:oxidoreductase n=1 Tax=Gorillibacterium sp. CAU 1737 TaxID=3140362 RepID=UPI003261B686